MLLTQGVVHTPRPVTQGVAHAAPLLWHKALRTRPPPVTQAAAHTPPRDLNPWFTGEKSVALTTELQPSMPVRTGTTLHARPPSGHTQGVAHTPDTRRCAHGPLPWHKALCTCPLPGDTGRCAHAPPPWHKALRPSHPSLTQGVAAPPPLTQGVVHKPPPWHKALCTRPLRDLGPWPTGEKCVALTTKQRPSAHRHHASCTSPPVTQGVAFRLPFVTQGATHTPSRWHKALCTPLLRHAHNALRTCPPHDTMRCAHGAKKATRGPAPPTPQNAKQA